MRTALLLTAAFILGVAAGFLLSHLAPPGADTHREERFAGSPASEARPAPAVARLTAEQAAASGDPAGAPDEAAAIVPSKPGDSGPGVITGTVRTESGKPVAGVQIIASSNSPGSRGRRGRASRETRTGPDGGFRLEALPLASHSIEAFLLGHEIHSESHTNASDLWPDAFIAFIAEPVILLPVEVLLPDGSPPEAAVIECARRSATAGGRNRRTWSRSDPALRLPPGLYNLTALHGKDRWLKSDPAEVDLRAGKTPSRVTLRLEGRPGIRGRVIFPEGEDIDSVSVHAMRWNAPTPPGFRDFLGNRNSALTRSADGHSYVFENLPPGRYLLGINRAPEKIEAIEEVEIKDHMTVKDLVLPPLEPAEYVVLWVLDPNGDPTVDVRLEAGCSTERGSSSMSITPICRPDGSLWVFHHQVESCSRDGKMIGYHIAIESAHYGTRRVEYRLPREEPLVVQFYELANLEVQVAGYAGSGHEGWIYLFIQAKETAGERSGNRGHVVIASGEIDIPGRTKFHRIEPGEYELAIAVKNHIGMGRHSFSTIASQPITLLSGRNEVTVPLPPLYNLAVQTGGESVRLDIRLYTENVVSEPGFHISGLHSGPGGLVTIERIPAGRYQLTALGGPSGEMLVDVPARSHILFSPRPFDSMRVQISDPAGYLARAGFRSGDLIVGIDGTAFENETHMGVLIQGARIKEQVVLSVLRAGGRIEVPFNPKMQRKNQEFGGLLVPSSR